PWRHLARRRPRSTRGGATAARTRHPPDLEGDGTARRSVAAVAGRGRLHAVVLLSHDQAARGRADPGDADRAEDEWLNLTVRGSIPARVRRANWSCSCTAT